MPNTLHIFNGDSTKSIFLKSGLAGDYVVWREMLCSGPTIADIHSPEFWKLRETFIHERHGAEDYKELMYEPLAQTKWKSYDSIVLWFEYDLFCLINLVAAISYVAPQTQASLLTVDLRGYQTNPVDHLKALGEIEAKEFPEINGKLLQLTNQDINFAKDCWKAYSTEKNHIKFFTTCNYSSNVFPFLSIVFPEHLARIPEEGSYSFLDQQIHELLKTNSEKETLIKSMSNSQLGYGDSQWDWHIKRVIKYSPLSPQNWNELYDYQLGGFRLNRTKNIN